MSTIGAYLIQYLGKNAKGGLVMREVKVKVTNGSEKELEGSLGIGCVVDRESERLMTYITGEATKGEVIKAISHIICNSAEESNTDMSGLDLMDVLVDTVAAMDLERGLAEVGDEVGNNGKVEND